VCKTRQHTLIFHRHSGRLIYLFHDGESVPHPPHGFVYISQNDFAKCHIWGEPAGKGGYNPKIQTRVRFLYSAPTHLCTKFHHLMFNHLEVIMLTNKHTKTNEPTSKQMPLKTSTLLCYAMLVDNYEYYKGFKQHYEIHTFQNSSQIVISV